MIPRPVILKGKALKEFEEYQNRTPTEEEIRDSREAEEFYLANPIDR